MKGFVRKIIQNKWARHLGFWLVSVYVIASYFSISHDLLALDVSYSVIFHICLVPLVYTHLRILFPRWFERERYMAFAFYALVLVGLTVLMHDFLFDRVVPRLLTGFYIVSFTDQVLLVNIFLIYLGLTSLIKLSESWFHLQQVSQEKTALELAALKTQINPHFLFNGLNSIYSLALQQKPETADAVLKLSELLRYSLYEVSGDEIPLDKEVEMVHHYIGLQKLRFDPNANIHFEVDGELEGYSVAPMLFLPFLENAFKHSNLTSRKGFIQARITRTLSGIHFQCANSLGKRDHPDEKYGGIGIENIRRRLELLYPDRHQLQIKEENDAYLVDVTLLST